MPISEPINDNKHPLSVFIIAKNEADRIQQAIESVIDWVDEVIVIDSGSTDDTVEIAEKSGATVFFNEWQGYGQQKRFGEDQCQHEWILNIDADERVSPEARQEILSILAGTPEHDGYRVRIVDVMPFQKIPRPLAWAVTQIRLYNRQRGRFRDHSTHDAVVMEIEKTGMLRSPFYHQSIRSFSHLVSKANFYTDMQADDLTRKGRKVGAFRLLIEFPATFFKAYLFRRYFIYGLYGVSFSMIFAFSKFLRLAKRYEQQCMDKQ